MASATAPLSSSFWSAVRERSHRLLMLDYDGTLAAFRVARHEAVLDSEILGDLAAIAGSVSTELAVVSGRPLQELERFLAPLAIHLVGEHGWDERTADGRRIQHPLPDAAAHSLEAAWRAAVAEGWGDRVERKRASLVLHTRGLDPSRTAEIERSADERWGARSLDGTRLAVIHGGRELRALGRDKGVAVQALMYAAPASALPVYLGDDETDEDAFRAVSPRGWAIRVGAPLGASHAQAALASQEEVGEFLRRWRDLTPGAAPR